MSPLAQGADASRGGAARLVAAISAGGSEIVSLGAALVVPPVPPPHGTVFVWPGLQPSRPWEPIDNGVLQMVLTWGPSCAPGAKPADHSSWWVSAQYVNSFGKRPGFTGCHGGRVMRVASGDTLRMTATLVGTTWHQEVRDLASGDTVDFDFGLQGQRQGTAFFEVETYDGGFVPLARFDHVTVGFRDPVAGCRMRVDTGVSATRPRHGADARTCDVDRISVAMPSPAQTSGLAGQRPLASCLGSERLASVGGGAAKRLSFRSEAQRPVGIFWIDYDGHRVKYADLAPGGVYSLSTYVGHPWLVANETGACLGIARATTVDTDLEFVVRTASRSP